MPAPRAPATSDSKEQYMIRNMTMATLAVCLLWPAASVTQESPRTRVRTRPRVRVETRNGPFGVYTFNDNRGRIGVTPRGPAEKAGLKVGDVITRFNGTALGGVKAESEDEDASGPGMKLIGLARELEPGDTVQIEYRRGTDARKATIVAEDLEVGGRVEMGGDMMGPMERLKELMPPGGEPGVFGWAFGSPWGGIEMVKLNPDLGDYFGTREGVLVVKAPED